jgi:hypothetical protein
MHLTYIVNFVIISNNDRSREEVVMSDQAAVTSLTYYDMTDAAFESALRTIVSLSTSEDEVRRRVRDELGYPYTLSIASLMPTDTAGCEARAVVIGLGGLTLGNGAMVMVMAHAPSGAVLQL